MPTDFLAGLTSHYLYASLNNVLYSTLLAGNLQRQADITEKVKILLLAGEAQLSDQTTGV